MNIFNIFKRSKKDKVEDLIDEPIIEKNESEEIQEDLSYLVEEYEILEDFETENQMIIDDPINYVIDSNDPTIEEEVVVETETPIISKVEEDIVKRDKYEPINQLEPYSSDLTKFLDYFWAKDGQKDGYYLHSSEFLKKRKIGLISEFQRLIEKRVDELKQEKLSCKLMIIDLKESSPSIIEKLLLRIELCDDYIQDLHNEKVISNSNNGLIRGVITQYEFGFDQGMSDYLTDNVFLNPLKRL